MQTKAKHLTPAQLIEARDWVSECVWGDVPGEDDISDMTDRQIERGVARFFDGGIAGFVATCQEGGQ